MSIQRTNQEVKFGRTIRLGQVQDLDNAVAGEVELGSLRDTGTHLERWDGTKWQKIGPGIWANNVEEKTANYTAVVTDDVILVDATAGEVTVTLFTAVGNEGKYISVIKTDISANQVITDTFGSETINDEDDASTSTQYTSLTYVSDNTNWRVI